MILKKYQKRKSEEIDENKLKISRIKSKSDFEEIGESTKIKITRTKSKNDVVEEIKPPGKKSGEIEIANEIEI